MKYCQHCGTQLPDNAGFCLNCGRPTTQTPVNHQQILINTLSSRLKTNGIIWIVIACFQILIALNGGWTLLFIGILNVITAVNNINSSKNILTNQNGIVAAYEPLVSPIITLAYNLVFGGIIGVLGSLYYLIFIRGYVMENKQQFLSMEISSPPQNTNTTAGNAVYVNAVLTAEEAYLGVEKNIYVADLQKTLKVSFPKYVQQGQVLALRNVTGNAPTGEMVTKDVYVKVIIYGT